MTERLTMTTKKKRSAKKIFYDVSYYLFLIPLTFGASLDLGLLSFSGMYALLLTLGSSTAFLFLPISVLLLPLPVGAFILAVGYEGQIYWKSLQGAFNKLFYKSDYLKRDLANRFLMDAFPDDLTGYPEIFKDYKNLLKQLDHFGHDPLDEASELRKRLIQKRVSDLEKLFTRILFGPVYKEEENLQDPTLIDLYKRETTEPDLAEKYEKELRQWLAKNQQQEVIDKLHFRQKLLYGVNAFSIVSGFFMGLGTTYLLVEAFATVPFLAVISPTILPFLIVPASLVAGIAYGFLTYNAIVDMINNETIQKRWNKLVEDFKNAKTPADVARNIFMSALVLTLAGLAAGLTFCTAGTWWTVAKNSAPLFAWMSKLPTAIMGIINPLITGISALIFNIQNTSVTIDEIEEELNSEENIFIRTFNTIKQECKELYARENMWQLLNPARILIKITLTPLLLIFFVLHLVSIAVTGDQVPGISEIWSALLCLVAEGFEDWRIIFPGEHEHHHKHEHGEDGHHHHDFKELLKERLEAGQGHDHSDAIPTVVIKWLFSPLFLLATLWAYGTSQLNASSPSESSTSTDPQSPPPPVLTFAEAWAQQRGKKLPASIDFPKKAKPLSEEGQASMVNFLIERHKEKQLKGAYFNPENLAEQKIAALNDVQQTIRKEKETPLHTHLKNAADNPIFNRHRQPFLFFREEKTATQDFIDCLPERVGIVAPCA